MIMTVHARPSDGVAFGERYGLYATLAAIGPITAGELARRIGLPPAQISHWLDDQARGDYLVRDARSGRYQNWSDIGVH